MRSDERMYHVKDVRLQEVDWKLVVGGVAGKIYKIHLSFIADDKAGADRAFSSMRAHLESQMGKYNEHSTGPAPRVGTPGDMYVWDRAEGNTILEERSVVGFWGVNVFLTAASVANLR